MSAGDCDNCGGDGHLPGSLGATRCPVCHGTGNRARRPLYENSRFMVATILVLLTIIGILLFLGCGGIL